MLDHDASRDRAEAARLSADAWKAFARGAFRFVCAAAIMTAIEIYRRRTDRLLPFDRRVVAAMIAFALAGSMGFVLLWRSRAGAAREVLDSAAMMGFWTGIFALFA